MTSLDLSWTAAWLTFAVCGLICFKHRWVSPKLRLLSKEEYRHYYIRNMCVVIMTPFVPYFVYALNT